MSSTLKRLPLYGPGRRKVNLSYEHPRAVMFHMTSELKVGGYCRGMGNSRAIYKVLRIEESFARQGKRVVTLKRLGTIHWSRWFPATKAREFVTGTTHKPCTPSFYFQRKYPCSL